MVCPYISFWNLFYLSLLCVLALPLFSCLYSMHLPIEIHFSCLSVSLSLRVIFIIITSEFFGKTPGTAAMLLVMVWKPHISILSITTILRYIFCIFFVSFALPPVHDSFLSCLHFGLETLLAFGLFGLVYLSTDGIHNRYLVLSALLPFYASLPNICNNYLPKLYSFTEMILQAFEQALIQHF